MGFLIAVQRAFWRVEKKPVRLRPDRVGYPQSKKGASDAPKRAGMTMTDVQRLAVPRVAATYVAGAQGLAAGNSVLTLDGALPVEHLLPGDGVITRRGARRLRSIRRMDLPRDIKVVKIGKSALGGRPERDIWLPPGQKVLLRDWRAQALCGTSQAAIPVERLVDGEFIRWAKAPAGAACLVLEFDAAEVVYADGLELTSADPSDHLTGMA